MFGFSDTRLLVHSGQSIVLLVIIALSVSSSLSPCQPVEIGQHLQLDCPCDSRRSSVYWEITSATSEKVEVSACDLTSHLTLDSSSKMYVTNNQTHSLLSLTHVTTDDMNRQIQCIDEVRTRDAHPICNLQVFYKPETPFCVAETSGQKRVRIMCKTPKVFPGLKCNIVYMKSRDKRQIDATLIKYDYTTINSTQPRYLQGSCGAEILDLEPGAYQLFAVLKPNVTFVYNSSVVARPNPTFMISSTSDAPTVNPTSLTTKQPQSLGYVIIQREVAAPSALCHDADLNITVLCEAHDFGSLPRLTVFFNYKNDGQYLHHEVKSLVNVSRIRGSFTTHANHQDANITCVARTPFGNVTNQTELGIEWLPQIFIEARLVSNYEKIIDRIQINTVFHVIEFTCGVNTDTSFIYIKYFLVHCMTRLGDNILKKEYVENNFTLLLNLTNVNERVRCTCSAIHKIGCSVRESHFEVEISEVEISTMESSFNVSPYHPIIFIAVIASTLTVSILVVLLLSNRQRVKKYCLPNSTSDSHIYEDIEDRMCPTGCMEYINTKCSTHSSRSLVVGRGQSPEVNLPQAVTPLLRLSPSSAQSQAEYGPTVKRSLSGRTCPHYVNIV